MSGKQQPDNLAVIWQQCEIELESSITQMLAVIDCAPNQLKWHQLLAELAEHRAYARDQKERAAIQQADCEVTDA